MSHISVERNRRRQMNDHLKVLRTLTPSFYIKKADQASIIGGVIDFIKELHQVLQSLESQKRRKSLSPSPSPGQPSPTQPMYAAAINTNVFQFDHSQHSLTKELVATCNSPVADVEAKISGANVILRTVSKRIPGQPLKIITLLEANEFEILHLSISSMDDTVLYSFLVKIGFGCQLSMEELALQVQQTFTTNCRIDLPNDHTYG